jgi:glutamyl-tRNA synthetase
MDHTPQFTRTRIAPTPSGFLHLGNVLSLALTCAWAQRTGAKVLLRIDDMDRDRYDPHYVQDIFDTLHFLDIPWDEGPKDLRDFEKNYSQIHRLDLYTKVLQRLQEKGLLFACTCSRSRLSKIATDSGYPGTCRSAHHPLDGQDVNWRLLTDPAENFIVPTIDNGNGPASLGNGTASPGNYVASLPASMRDPVVRKKDGSPAYQLTSIVDDQYFNVDLVIRGEDLWPSTIAQLCLAAHLPNSTFHTVHFLHHPLLRDENGEKLSKSAGATSIQYLRKQSMSAADIYTLIGKQMGLSTSVHDWQSLSAAIWLK